LSGFIDPLGSATGFPPAPRRDVRGDIGFGINAGKMWRWHRSTARMIEDIIDSHVHEYAHAFIPPGIPHAVEERWALAFERAGIVGAAA